MAPIGPPYTIRTRARLSAGKPGQAFRQAPQRMQFSVSRDSHPQAPWSGRCPAKRHEIPAGRRPEHTPVQMELYGFIRSPVAERGSNCKNTSRS